MKFILAGIGFVVALVAVFAVCVGLGLFGLRWNRFAQPYSEETRKITYDTSRAYQQGAQLTLSRYCYDWRTADVDHKAAMADLIRSTAATYQGPLPADVQSCLESVR